MTQSSVNKRFGKSSILTISSSSSIKCLNDFMSNFKYIVSTALLATFMYSSYTVFMDVVFLSLEFGFDTAGASYCCQNVRYLYSYKIVCLGTLREVMLNTLYLFAFFQVKLNEG